MFTNLEKRHHALSLYIHIKYCIYGQIYVGVYMYVRVPMCVCLLILLDRTAFICTNSPGVFIINQLYQSCAMHHKSLIVLMQTILQDLSHLSPSVAIVCVRRERDASSYLGSYESFIGFHRPRRENALNVFAIIPLITALCTWAKPTIRNCKLVSQ